MRTLVRTNLYVLLIKGSTRRRVKKKKWANYLAAEVIEKEKVRTEQVLTQVRTKVRTHCRHTSKRENNPCKPLVCDMELFFCAVEMVNDMEERLHF